ncbi:MAG: hypothetical protein AAB401_07800 [Acidobacteriota bacterium]
MDKETIALIVAQNGLKNAAAILATKAAKQEKKADTAVNGEAKAKLVKDSGRAKKLAAALAAADKGISAYLSEAQS